MSIDRPHARCTYAGPGPWEVVEPRPYNEVPDLTRAALRLAAEVAIAEACGQRVPQSVTSRVAQIFQIMARG